MKPSPYNPELCIEPGCPNIVMGRGLCSKHLRRRQREGRPLPPAQPIVGGSKPGRRTWTPEDDAYLEERWGQATPQAIALRLGRTYTAVRLRAKRMGLGLRGLDGSYSARELERELHLCDRAVSRQWRAKGLRFGRTCTAGAQRINRIMPAELRRFLIAHPEAYDWTQLSHADRTRLGLGIMPVRPTAKIVRCKRCRSEHTLPLDAVFARCPRCQSIMSKWAVGYVREVRSPRFSVSGNSLKAGRQTTCLRCLKEFASPDPRTNRICPRCRHREQQAESAARLNGDESPRYAPRVYRSVM